MFSIQRSNLTKKRVAVAFANEDGSEALRMDCEVDVLFIPVTKEYHVTGPGVPLTCSGQHRDLSVAILDWLRIAILDMSPKWSDPKPEGQKTSTGRPGITEIDRLIADGEKE